jgi:CHAT domain-containing protein/tetratricopeptide (TPR) repeat protein
MLTIRYLCIPLAVFTLGMCFSAHAKAWDRDSRAPLLQQAAKNDTQDPGELTEQAHDLMGDGHWRQALNKLNLAVSLYKNDDSSGLALALARSGRCHYELSECNEAIRLYKGAIQIYTALHSDYQRASLFINIGSAYQKLGAWTDAVANFKSSQAIVDQSPTMGNRDALLAAIQNNFGIIEILRSNYSDAIPHFKSALLTYQKLGDDDNSAYVLNNLGLLYSALGQHDRAIDYFDRCLKMFDPKDRKVDPSPTLICIGDEYRELKKYPRAKQFYIQGLTIAEDRLNVYSQADAQYGLGLTQTKQKNYGAALKSLNASLAARRQVQDAEGEAMTVCALAELGLAQSKYVDAKSFGREALIRFRAVGDKEGGARALDDLRSAYASTNPRLAIFFGKQAVNSIQSVRAGIAVLDTKLRLSFVQSKAQMYRDLANLLIQEGRLPEAEEVVRSLKNEEINESSGRTRSSSGTEVSLTPEETLRMRRWAEISDKIGSIGEKYERLLSLKDSGEITAGESKELSQLSNDIVTANTAFRLCIDEMNQEFHDDVSRRVQVSDTQSISSTLQNLPPHTVAVYAITGQTTVRLVVVTPTLRFARESKIMLDHLREKIVEFREALQDPTLDPRPLGKQLYDVLVQPISHDLQAMNVRTVMWSLDGILRYLPVEALYDGHEYFVEKYESDRFSPLLKDRLRASVSAKWRVLALGVSKPQQGFPALYDVPGELHAIVKEGKTSSGVLPGKVLLDEKFTRGALLSNVGMHFPVVHIASHFAFVAGDTSASYLLLGDGAHLSTADITDLPANTFAGVQLLTLSACNTAMGEDGDGVELESFPVTAEQHGADSVLASLWAVADRPTRLLMAAFYRNRVEHPEWTKLRSLKEAQRTLIHGKIDAGMTASDRSIIPESVKSAHGSSNAPHFRIDPSKPFAHPYYWAPFILYGNWK